MLKVFGIRLGNVGRSGFEQAVRDAVCGDPVTFGMMECMLRARDALWTEYLTLNKLVMQIAMRDELCRRLMAIPSVGPVTATRALRRGIRDTDARQGALCDHKT